ncbi:MAG: hypothetical protein HOI10_05480 [Deltaproteobacteria bacterium]|nr:hypothetical protein [Deltaproteobacteria bacterium]
MTPSSDLKPTFDVTCAVPRTGRTLHNFLSKLKRLGADSEEIEQILKILSSSKRRSTPDMRGALNFLQEISTEAPPCFSISVDRKRKLRPYRLGFLGYEWKIGKTKIRVEGEEPHNGSSLIKLDEVDFTVVGLDELLSMTQHYLADPTRVTKWGMYNYQLTKPTSIRVAGSAMLTSYNKLLGGEVQDMVGFFLISKKGGGNRSLIELGSLSRHGRHVFVKGRYSGIVMAAYPQLQVEPVEDVEEAVMTGEKGSVGLEIVQSGNTLKSKGLLLHGSPLFLSESLYVVDYDRFQQNPALRKLVETLNPIGYFEEERLENFSRWYYALEQNLGDAWMQRPKVDELFCKTEDIDLGLRPYRLRTRNWKPDDRYLREEAISLAQSSRQKVLKYYQELL